MQHEAIQFSHWFSSSQMLINSSETKILSYHNKTKSLPIAGEQIQLVALFKLLGLIIQSNCKCDLQIKSCIRKASKRIFPLREGLKRHRQTGSSMATRFGNCRRKRILTD
jgi:hypothetical protein